MKTQDSSLVKVVANTSLGGGRFRLKVSASEIHLQCRPGQFFNIVFPDSSPYLPRPFSIYEIFSEAKQLDFLIAAVGEGTDKLAQCNPGEELLLVGPLGNGFPLHAKAPQHIFVAGSIGLAPFIELHRELKKQSPTCPHTLIYGARNRAELVDREFLESLDWDVKTCTDDGSFGTSGRVTDVLKALNPPQGTLFYTCGPTPMMKAVSTQVLQSGHQLWVSMEEHMACGIGVCKGCVIFSQKAPPPNPTICREGPIFEAAQIFSHS